MWFRRHNGPITPQDLSDFADGQLPRARAARVAAHLRSHPSDADRVHGYWRREAELYRAFDAVFKEPELRPWQTVKRRHPMRVLPWAVALGALMLTAGLLWERLDSGPLSRMEFTAAALEAYMQGPDVEPAASATSPSLTDLDLKAEGRRTIRLNSREVIEYRYRDEDGRGVALYEVEAGADAAGLFQIFEQDGTRLVEWTMADKRYALVGEDSASALTHLAVRIRGNLVTQPSAVTRALGTRPGDKDLDLNGEGAEQVMVQQPATDGNHVNSINNTVDIEVGPPPAQNRGTEM